MNKAGGNWVVGEQFFDREAELAALAERVQAGTHTLLTAQRRMGKTSLVRELLRRLEAEGQVEAVFVDLEGSHTAQDAIAEIALQSGETGGWKNWLRPLANRDIDLGGSVKVLGQEAKLQLRAGINAGNWQHKGDQVLRRLADKRKSAKVLLAIDELPILLNRLLKGNDESITPEGKRAADEFLSWLRKNGQEHQGKVSMILSGSIGLEPILQQAGLSAHANVYAPFDLKPWDEETAAACLAALAETYGIDLPEAVRKAMCRQLRCQIPHHIQRFFDVLHEDLRRADRTAASQEDVERVYRTDMLGVRGQMDMPHYESRLRTALGDQAYRIALEMLTEAAAASGLLSGPAIAHRRQVDQPDVVDAVLRVLEHDGYFERHADGYRFISRLLEDWWRGCYGRSVKP